MSIFLNSMNVAANKMEFLNALINTYSTQFQSFYNRNSTKSYTSLEKESCDQ
jgi:hypothetical protein